MKVAFLAYSAGARRELSLVGRALVARGHSAFFIAPGGVDIAGFSTCGYDANTARGALRNAAALWRLRRDITAMVAREKPDVVVVNRDRGNDVIACMLFAARSIGARVVAIDVGLTSAAFKARTRHNQLSYDARRAQAPLLNRIVARVLPEQVRDDVLFHPPGKTLALRALSMLPPRPWHNGENGADVHLMQSEASVAAARAEGAHARNVVVAGLPSLDELYAATREREAIRAELSLNRDVCVFALPQLAEQKIVSLDQALQDFHDVLAAIPPDVDVLASLHPSMSQSRYASLESRRGGFRIVDMPLSRVMAIADISIHGFPTTTTWSRLVGAHTVFLDWWRQGYASTIALDAGVIVNRDRSRLPEDLIARSPSAHALRDGLPPFDGKCTERIVDALLS